GTMDGIVEGNARKLLQGMIIGAIGGTLLGYVGMILGEVIFNVLGGRDQAVGNPSIAAFSRQVIARSFGWAMMGLGLGVGAGPATRSPKRIWHGAIGGFLGGFLGGVAFDILANIISPVQEVAGASGPRDVGGPSRLVGFTAIGGLTGFFIGLVEELLKQA